MKKEDKMKKSIIFILCLSITIFSGCGTKVKRVDVKEVIDISGRWNDTDSRLTAEAMIKDALDFPWVNNFQEQHGGRKPVVIVGRVINKSHEHINTETFIKDLERELIRSGKVMFVASSEERDQARQERLDQLRNADPATAKQIGKEIGADFILIGSINSILDEVEGRRVVYYQIDLQLVNIETNIIAWQGQHKIKKDITRPSIKP
jgi:uncharacterized protein (TIGR02722 family)